jgi:ArsR family transcriptional regulator, arsenate/arsenite/antimonite-responsive transcriptional repressor
MIDKYTRFFKALGEPTRLKILKLLAEKELCVCDLINVLDMNQPRISQHLKVLKDAGVIKERKQAQWSYYSLCCDDFHDFMEAFSNFIKEDLANIGDLKKEYQRMNAISESDEEDKKV